MEDNELVKAYEEGDEAALAELIERYADRLFAFAYRLSGDRALAEDAVQNAFVKVWKNLRKFDENRSFKAWIFSIARNATIDLLRAKKDVTFSSFDREDTGVAFSDTLADASAAADELFDQATNVKMLEEILAGLSVDSRAVVLLHDKENLTFEEIGHVLKEPLNTVKSRYHRAILALRKAINGHGRE